MASSPGELAKEITMEHARLERVRPGDAEAMYVAECMSGIWYCGASVYDGAELVPHGPPRRIVIAVHRTGLLLLSAGTMSLIERCGYLDALSYSVSLGTVVTVSTATGGRLTRRQIDVGSHGTARCLLANARDHAAATADPAGMREDAEWRTTLEAAEKALGTRFGFEYLDSQRVRAPQVERQGIAQRAVSFDVPGNGSRCSGWGGGNPDVVLESVLFFFLF
jgi:hypothetical protein